MKRLAVLVVAALLAMMVFAPVGLAQETTTTIEETTLIIEDTGGPLPRSGGPAILLPAAALLLGSGVLAFAVLRRR